MRFKLTTNDPQDQRPNGLGGPQLDQVWREGWFLLVGELVQVPHYPETRASPGGYLDRA